MYMIIEALVLQGIFKAVKMAKRIIGSGLSELGIVCNDDLPQSLIHRTVSKIIRKQEEVVYGILKPLKNLLQSITDVLVENERLSGDELRRQLLFKEIRTETGA